MQVLDLLVLILAAWRLSVLLAREDMPFLVLERLRYEAEKRQSWLAMVVGGVETEGCIRCMSVYVAALLLGLCHISPYGWWLVYVLALSAVVIVLDKVIK